MASSILHQAVELAQAGRREEARQLIWQYLQSDPSNETAWLWLASVAADQPEYQRALNEVLRINPNNQQAQQLLAQFQQQYGAAAPPSVGVSYGVPPQAAPSYTPPPPVQGTPAFSVQGTPPQRGYGMYAPPQPVEVKVETRGGRRGCLGCGVPGCGCLGCGGCGQGCILLLLVIIIVPIVFCGGLTFTGRTLGPLDLPAAYLPGEMGRKDITFDATLDDQPYQVSASVPRTWYIPDDNNEMWVAWRSMLDDALTFTETSTTWADFETEAVENPLLIDINPAVLAEGGDVIIMRLVGSASGNYSCSQVQSASYDEPPTNYGGGLCGYRTDEDTPGPINAVMSGAKDPGEAYTITFYVPLNQSKAAQWQIYLPKSQYSFYEDDIKALIESIEIDPQ
ncbi:MAG: hypothetical protein HY866_12910 [Chloroflexi bacterium]|nr:hypothetical protein [Chloroflexota bacterium]